MALLFSTLLLISAGAPTRAQELRFSTENDIFGDGSSHDDLYTFAVALELDRGKYHFALREYAFTDRAAGTRFDETHIAVSRALPAWRSWQPNPELGLVRVGRGLFGQDVQNDVHSALGSEEVELPYEDPSLYARFALTVERPTAAGDGAWFGPRLELDLVPGLRAHAVVAVQVRWRPNDLVAVDALVGGRYSEAWFAPLEPHVERLAAVARIGITLYERIFLAWTYNDHGDGRDHLSLGYSFANWRLGAEERVRE